MLPYYSIFDNIGYRVDGDVVTLYGQVVWPTLKSDAGNVVKRIEGVHRVDNQIEVLPLSPMDNRSAWHGARDLRLSHAATIWNGRLPPIHIIVKNGDVTLEGVVANEADKNIAEHSRERCLWRVFGEERSAG